MHATKKIFSHKKTWGKIFFEKNVKSMQTFFAPVISIIIPDKKVFFVTFRNFDLPPQKYGKSLTRFFRLGKKKFWMGQKKFRKIFLLENVSKCQDLNSWPNRRQKNFFPYQMYTVSDFAR